MRKVCVITGTRAEYGVMRPLLSRIKKSKSLKLQLIVTGMHLMREYGSTVALIEEDGFSIAGKLKMFSSAQAPLDIAQDLGNAIIGFARLFQKLQPDLLVLEADRIEMLAAALASLSFNLPVVHISGGDISGGLDDSIRHTISRFSHLHLSNTKASCQRLAKMGEAGWRIKYVGTLAVSKKILREAAGREELVKRLNLDLSRPLFLVVQHPVMAEAGLAEKQIRATLEAIGHFKEQSVVIYPNCDLGSKAMIEEIEKYRRFGFIHIYKNLERRLFLGLVKHASLMLGNSSSGIVEAPFFGTPVVNIGTRQDGRERAGNVTDVDCKKSRIISAIKRFRNSGFRRIFKNNPYCDKNTERRIVRILETAKLDQRLLNKQLAF
jgi:UDP-hydrolysing UDP-N-acetyl-D-glucosamine 2-epimerase